MRRYAALLCAVIVLGGCKGKKAAAPPAAAGSAVPAGMARPPRPRIASPMFELDIGSVHERYQDANGAAEHYAKAAAAAENGVDRARAFAALSRVKELAGNRDAAIEALERARQALSAHRPPAGPARAMGQGDDILPRLARLYLDRGLVNEAQKVVDEALATPREGWQREEVLRVQADLWQKAGILEAKLAEKERALELPMPDEGDLWFLAAALGRDLLPRDGATGFGPMRPADVRNGKQGQLSQASPTAGKLVRVYERLHELRPGDAQVRNSLMSLLERAGRTDDAVTLALSAPEGSTACMDGPVGLPPSNAFSAVVEAARIRVRAGQAKQAVAEVEREAAQAKRDGIPGYLALARLYLELRQPKLASKAIDQAARDARSALERRQIALARARFLSASGAASELATLHAEWRKSGDPCLARAAAMPASQPRGGMPAAPPGIPIPAIPAVPANSMPVPAMPSPGAAAGRPVQVGALGGASR